MFKFYLKPLLFILTYLITNATSAQFFSSKNYPRSYFEYPVMAVKSLVANFGELRPNHYHMGLDCRTEQVQNKKVIAAAAGYIAKVKIEPWGFGRCIYINHPNGLTTLYAHLNNFYPALESFIKQQQYALKSWAVFLDIPANLFPVQKGDTIALSGNTGGSQGPHLHFEIRDTKTDKVLNPILFDFDIPDTIAPLVTKLAVYDRNISTYEQSPKMFLLKKTKDTFTTNPPIIIVNSNKISFGITATDRFNENANPNGIFETVLYHNDEPVAGFQLDSIGYNETRYMNAHIDYKARSNGGGYIQHISKLPGYNNSIYKTTKSDGVITLNDDGIHKIKMEVTDANGNTSLVKFNIQRNVNLTYPEKNDSASYFQQASFHPGFVNIFENAQVRFHLPANSLYDSIRFQYKEIAGNTGFPVYQLHNTGVPVHTYFSVTLKTINAIPDKMVMRRFSNGKDDYTKAEAANNVKEKDWYKASFREFGNFQLMIDTLAPVITPIGFKNGMNCSKQSRFVFVVKDNTEEIKQFTATLDGNWLRFSNDKGSRFVYDFDEMCAPGEHELRIKAEDQVGNVTEKVYRFTR